jgi:predicted ABC-type ATPase
MARLIVVSGPNGAGKTTLIKNSRTELKHLGYEIIIPDELVSGSGTPLSDAIAYCISQNKNTIFETPLQYRELAEQVKKFVMAGYKVVLVQLFLENTDSSALRVKQRLTKGGINIPSDEVKLNFEGNYKNIIHYHHLFYQSYFIDASNFNHCIVAELNETKIKYYNPVQSAYLNELLYEIVMSKKGNKESLAILKNNKLFGGLSFKKMAKVIRVIFRLKNNRN